MEDVHKALLHIQEETNRMEKAGLTDRAKYFELKKIEMNLQLVLLQY